MIFIKKNWCVDLTYNTTNLQQIIFKWKRRYWQILKMDKVWTEDIIMMGKISLNISWELSSKLTIYCDFWEKHESKNMQWCESNFTEIVIWHGCSPVNLLHNSRTPFCKNTSGRLLFFLQHLACDNIADGISVNVGR